MINALQSRMAESFPWWEGLCGAVAETFRFTGEEQEAFAGNKTAKLIGAIPFAAGCEEPERTALAHLALYVTELRGGALIGGHTPTDNKDLFTRLRLISSFTGGNREVINHGLNWLALIMLMGYERSQEADLRNGVYNPLNDGSWDAAPLKRRLMDTIRSNPCEILDGIFYDPSGMIVGW